MQVAFFTGNNPSNLEEKINAWLKEHTDIATHLIVQTQDPDEKGKPGRILITLWYSELPPGLDLALRHGPFSFGHPARRPPGMG